MTTWQMLAKGPSPNFRLFNADKDHNVLKIILSSFLPFADAVLVTLVCRQAHCDLGKGEGVKHSFGVTDIIAAGKQIYRVSRNCPDAPFLFLRRLGTEKLDESVCKLPVLTTSGNLSLGGDQGCGAGAGAGVDTFWSEPEPPKRFARSRSRKKTGRLRFRKGKQLWKHNEILTLNSETTNSRTNRLPTFFINNFRTSAMNYLKFSSLGIGCE